MEAAVEFSTVDNSALREVSEKLEDEFVRYRYIGISNKPSQYLLSTQRSLGYLYSQLTSK